MKRFAFPLETALKVRKLEAEVCEAKLLRLERDRAQCRRAIDQLATEARKRPASISNGELVTAREIEDMERLGPFIKRERARLTSLEASLLHKIALLSDQLRQARQKVELLVKLKTKSKELWQKESDKELQTLAEESFNHQFQSRQE